MSAVRGYSDTVSRQFGPLEPVLVTIGPLEAGTVLDPRRAERSMERRRIPARFAPAGPLGFPSEAVGLETRVDLPVGSYVTSAVLGPPAGDRAGRGDAAAGVVPVEVSVHGVGALPGRGRRVDVLVSDGDGIGSAAGTRVAARSAILLDLSVDQEAGAQPGTGRVTLGLDRRGAVRLVDADAAGRRITVIPVPDR
jgi:hypothetical protein